MRKTKYTSDEIRRFFLKSNLNCWKLGELLGIRYSKIRSYLEGNYGAHLSGEEAFKIDTAIRLITEMDLESPKWTIGDYQKGLEWDDVVGEWNRKVLNLIEKRVKYSYDNALNIIMFIVSDGYGRDEFREIEDPLKNGGLDSYGKDEFMRHYMKTMVFTH